MKLNEHMISTLNKVKGNTDEEIMCPIIFLPDGKGYERSFSPTYNYMGLTEHNLLCGSARGDILVSCKCIPLWDVISIQVENLSFGQKKLHLTFKCRTPMSVIVSSKEVKLKNQRENLEKFISQLQAAADVNPYGGKSSNFAPDGIEGQKIRRQYFNFVLALFLFGLYLCVAFMATTLIADIIKGDTADTSHKWKQMIVTITSYFIMLSPLAILSLVNRLFFGKNVCTAGKKGLCLSGGALYKWKRINRVEYTPNISSRRHMSFCHLTVEMNNGTSFEIAYFPIYGMRVLKKYAPHIKTGLSKTGWIMTVGYLIFPPAMAIFCELFA